MSALSWKEIAPGQAEAVSGEQIAIYEISEVPIAKLKSEFQVRVKTGTGGFTLPRNFRTMSAAQRACKDHLNHWRCKIT